jgi:hypothetical protein
MVAPYTSTADQKCLLIRVIANIPSVVATPSKNAAQIKATPIRRKISAVPGVAILSTSNIYNILRMYAALRQR